VALRVVPDGVTISTWGGTVQFHTDPAANVTWTSLNPAVATVGPTTGTATAVTSGQVTIRAATERDTAYAVLTVALPGAGVVTQWMPQSLPSTPGGGALEDLYGVWGLAADHVHAVGAFERWIHYDGANWTLLQGRGFDVCCSLYRLGGTSPTDIWAVGGDVWHSDGSSIEKRGLGGPPVQYRDVWAASPRDVFVVGDSGTILHFDGRGWRAMSLVGAAATFADLHGVWGTSARNVIVVGGSPQESVIMRFDGQSWTKMSIPGIGVFVDVWGTSSSNVYAVTSYARVWRFDGSSWAEVKFIYDFYPTALSGTSPSDVFVVGSSSAGGDRIFHFDGNTWSETTTGTGLNATGVWGTMTDVFVTGFYFGTRGAVFRGTR
jgi:hypothetical protein